MTCSRSPSHCCVTLDLNPDSAAPESCPPLPPTTALEKRVPEPGQGRAEPEESDGAKKRDPHGARVSGGLLVGNGHVGLRLQLPFKH